MADQQPDSSVLRRIYEEILPLFHKAAAGEWAWFENPVVVRDLAQGLHPSSDACPPRIQGEVRCWQVVQWSRGRDDSIGCLPVSCPECAVWKAARPTLVEELGEAFNSLMYRMGRLDQTVERATHLTRDLASQWEDLELENRLIRETMARDALTGLYNRQQLDHDLAEVVSACRRRFRPVTVAMLDIDHFKDFNDTYGHPAGDRVLAQCGALLRETTRLGDRCYRYGGEEFVVMFLDTPVPVAQGIAERLRRKFAQLGFEVAGPAGAPERVSKTISVGLAQLRDGMTAADLLAAADEALYEAKRSGRNRVVMAATPAAGAPDGGRTTPAGDDLLPLADG